MKLQIQRAKALLNAKKPNIDKAMEVLKPLLKKKSTSWQAFHYAGVALSKKREYKNACNFLQEALSRGSDEPETWYLLSVVHLDLGNLDEAARTGQEALKRREDYFQAWLNLGSVYRAQARLEEALKCYQRANQLDPRSAGVAYRIATIYRDQGNLKKALELYDITVKINPEYYEAVTDKARLLQKLQKFDEAEQALEEILSRKPKDLNARITLSEIDRARGRYAEAISRYEEILSEHPGLASVRVDYAVTLQDIGRFNESEENYLRVFRDHPSSMKSFSNYLMGLHYNPERSRDDIFEAHKKWDRCFAPEERPERPEPVNKDPQRKLRIGLISGGFWRHPVGWMITAGLEHLPKEQFEVYCYTTNNVFDALTKRIHAVSDSWKSVIGYSNEVVADMIRDDEIDILVELSGHSADNRLKMVALEPAPVIVKWVGGLFNTTGLRSVDYLITDWHETPAGTESYYTEKLVRMPDDYICFLPPDHAPDVRALPSAGDGTVRFGCFNNPTKVNPVLLEKWAEIMRRVPGSRLILKSKQYDSEIFTSRIVEKMLSLGIAADRLEFEGQSPHTELLEKYNEVDVALDPWPYSGGLSTCEALWMGVPVVTLPGPTFAGRHSATHLANAGLSELVAENWDEYIEKAVSLAGDTEALAGMRDGLREQVRRSPLCDGERFGAHLDGALREMWKQRVAGWESGAEEWRDHIAVEAVEEVEVVQSSESVSKNVSGSESENVLNDASENVSGIISGNASGDVTGDVSNESTDISSNNGSSPAVNGRDETRHTEVSKAETSKSTVNGSFGNESTRNDKSKTWKIETKDEVVICTPADLNMLTPYVLLEQEQWYEPELQFVRDYLKPGMNVVDVGAGFGVYALPMAKKVGPEGKVYAFEPGSVCRRHLEMSKLENGFDHTEIIGKAVSDRSGKQSLKSADTPEQNKLNESGEEEVSAVVLDAWWQFEGAPKVDFLKVDVNGKESDVLKGATELLESESPVLVISITEQKAAAFAKEIKETGYKLYEYIPGPGVLAEHEIEAGADLYLQNLIAIPERLLDDFRKDGWLHNETITPKEVEQDLWKRELSKLPWTVDLMEEWENHDESEGIMSYLQALNYLIAAEKIDVHNSEFEQPRSQKTILMLNAAQILIQLYNQGANSTSVVFTLVRTLNALGKRDQAVEIMQKLIKTTKMGQENMDMALPFMLPVPEQDNASIKTDLSKWLMVKTVEAWILLKDLTTYLSGPQEQKLLGVLDGNPEVMDKIHFNKTPEEKLVLTADMEEKLNLPSKVVNARVKDFEILIPEKEIFRLKNILIENEYSLPDDYDISDDAIILDIGGNIGAFALYATGWNNKAKIYSFEPNPQVFPLLRINTQNHDNIKKYFFGLGDKNESLILYQNPVNTGASSTSQQYRGASKVKIEIKDALEVLKELNIEKIDVLKIDTEGAELSILKSLKPVLDKIQVIMLEYHSINDKKLILELLKDFEYYSEERQLSSEVGTIKCINRNFKANR